MPPVIPIPIPTAAAIVCDERVREVWEGKMEWVCSV